MGPAPARLILRRQVALSADDASIEDRPAPSKASLCTGNDRYVYTCAVENGSIRRVIGYSRVSTDEQVNSGLGLEAQAESIRGECERRGWDLLEIVTEDGGASGKSTNRAALQATMIRMDRRAAEVLMVSKIDRLSRSLVQGATVMDRAKRKGWAVVETATGVDMTTAAGQMVAQMMLVTAEYERRLISDRTRDALAAKKRGGAKVGQHTAYPLELVTRLKAMRADGESLRAIAATLTSEGIHTAKGGQWHASSVRSVLTSQTAAALDQEIA